MSYSMEMEISVTETDYCFETEIKKSRTHLSRNPDSADWGRYDRHPRTSARGHSSWIGSVEFRFRLGSTGVDEIEKEISIDPTE